MNLEDLNKIDTKKIYETYDRWPEIAKQSYKQEFSNPELKDIDHIVLAGICLLYTSPSPRDQA